MSDLLDELVAPKKAAAPAAPASPSPQPAAGAAPPRVSPAPVSSRPAFEATPSLAQRFNFRILIFAAIVLVPILGLGYIYFENATSDGIRQGADGYLHVDLQKMSAFEFDQRNGRVEDVPEQWRSLDGRKVALEGEMWVSRSAAGEVDEFDLVWSIANCCYSGTPQVQHFVKSKVVDGGRVRYYNRPVRVRGTLSVNVTKEGGQVSGVYHLAVENVEPLS